MKQCRTPGHDRAQVVSDHRRALGSGEVDQPTRSARPAKHSGEETVGHRPTLYYR